MTRHGRIASVVSALCLLCCWQGTAELQALYSSVSALCLLCVCSVSARLLTRHGRIASVVQHCVCCQNIAYPSFGRSVICRRYLSMDTANVRILRIYVIYVYCVNNTRLWIQYMVFGYLCIRPAFNGAEDNCEFAPKSLVSWNFLPPVDC